jgi:hypothetical protein
VPICQEFAEGGWELTACGMTSWAAPPARVVLGSDASRPSSMEMTRPYVNCYRDTDVALCLETLRQVYDTGQS